jgi:hypothetical protein
MVVFCKLLEGLVSDVPLGDILGISSLIVGLLCIISDILLAGGTV